MTRAAVPALCARGNRERGQVYSPTVSVGRFEVPTVEDCVWCGEAEPTFDCPECCPCDECYEDFTSFLLGSGLSPETVAEEVRRQFPSRVTGS